MSDATVTDPALDLLTGLAAWLEEAGETGIEYDETTSPGYPRSWSLMGDTGTELVIELVGPEDICDYDEDGEPAAPEDHVAIEAEIVGLDSQTAWDLAGAQSGRRYVASTDLPGEWARVADVFTEQRAAIVAALRGAPALQPVPSGGA